MLDNVKNNAEQRVDNVKADYQDLKSSVSGAYATLKKDNALDAALDLSGGLWTTLKNTVRRSGSSNRNLVGK